MDFLHGTPYNYTYIAIGLGMVISLFLTETIGVMAGGIIVPGYFALYLHNPLMVITTFSISLFTYATVMLISKFMLIYGRRRLILCLLLGFLFGYLLRIFLDANSFQISVNNKLIDLEYIGYIIPGLIASWMDRQGIVRTISVILITSSIVAMILIIISGGQVNV